MSYIEQSHLFGVEGIKRKSVYTELLEIVRPGGITAYIETLMKNLDDQEDLYV
jgi:hypothetical protein